jgi:hypothetical protein
VSYVQRIFVSLCRLQTSGDHQKEALETAQVIFAQTAVWDLALPFVNVKSICPLISKQTAYFVAIVIVQWADVIISKTRMLSIVDQGSPFSIADSITSF